MGGAAGRPRGLASRTNELGALVRRDRSLPRALRDPRRRPSPNAWRPARACRTSLASSRHPCRRDRDSSSPRSTTARCTWPEPRRTVIASPCAPPRSTSSQTRSTPPPDVVAFSTVQSSNGAVADVDATPRRRQTHDVITAVDATQPIPGIRSTRAVSSGRAHGRTARADTADRGPRRCLPTSERAVAQRDDGAPATWMSPPPSGRPRTRRPASSETTRRGLDRERRA